MSITDELREWAEEFWEFAYSKFGDKAKLLEIADRIDAEHEAKVSYWQGASYKDGYDEGFASADDWLGQHEDAMAEHGWVRLPVDADGECIRVGERVQLIGNDPSTVSHMSLADDGWRVYMKYDGGIGTGSGEPKRIRHHHKPTVEDVLREFADGIKDQNADFTELAIAEYAKRLQLAGDAE